MIIGKNKDLVIENIKKCVAAEQFNSKVEVDDPKLSDKEKAEIIDSYLKKRRTIGYKLCNRITRVIISAVTGRENSDTVIEGLENIKGLNRGAIVTSNHFNPLDNTVILKAVKAAGYKRLYIVSQDTNIAMTGAVGFIMKHADVIPITYNHKYLKYEFSSMLSESLEKGVPVLIYPEQEMWFNYRKPRPVKVGAYYFAAQNNVPIISCFIEIIDLPEKENDEFNKTKYVIHILKPIYPVKTLNVRRNCEYMMETDYAQKKEAYEKAYGKKLDYTFSEDDIAGWTGNKR